jgi:hypothetical protein
MQRSDHADAADVVGRGVPLCEPLQRQALEGSQGVELDLGGPALIRYAMLSFEHDVTHIKLLPWDN